MQRATTAAAPSALVLPLAGLLLFGLLGGAADTLASRLGFPGTEQQRLFYGYAVGIGFWVSAARFLDRLLAVLLWNRMATGAPRLLIDLASLGIHALALTAIVGSVFGQPLTGFWATSGVLGLVLGFALRNLILDLFTGIAVNVEQPYRSGDWVEIRTPGDSRLGRVLEMNWRTTRLATEEGDVVVIPNGMLATLVVTNRGAALGRMRGEMKVTLDFAIPVERARRILGAALAQVTDRPGFCPDAPPTVLVAGVGESGVEYLVRYWTTVWKELSPSAARDLVASAVVEHLRQAGLAPGHAKEDVFFAPMPARQLDTLSDADRAELLARVDLFRTLEAGELATVAAAMRRLTLHAGSTLLRAGDPGESMFIVVEGVLDVLVDDADGGAPRRVSRTGPGEVLGEMSLLTGEPRSATLVAATDVVAYEVTRAPITDLFAKRPEIAEKISAIVAARLAARRAAMEADGAARDRDADAEITAGQLLGRIRAVFRSAWR